MKALVVYESLWGNTAAVARAIAEGIGAEARALSTAEANAEAMTGVDLIVAGAPVLGFKLPTEKMREGGLYPSRRPRGIHRIRQVRAAARGRARACATLGTELAKPIERPSPCLGFSHI